MGWTARWLPGFQTRWVREDGEGQRLSASRSLIGCDENELHLLDPSYRDH
jgi:hypothetical protein